MMQGIVGETFQNNLHHLDNDKDYNNTNTHRQWVP